MGGSLVARGGRGAAPSRCLVRRRRPGRSAGPRGRRLGPGPGTRRRETALGVPRPGATLLERARDTARPVPGALPAPAGAPLPARDPGARRSLRGEARRRTADSRRACGRCARDRQLPERELGGRQDRRGDRPAARRRARAWRHCRRVAAGARGGRRRRAERAVRWAHRLGRG